MKNIIAIDPGANTSGVAIFKTGELVDLKDETLIELVDTMDKYNDYHWVIEDVNFFKGIYDRNRKGGQSGTKIAQNVGMCKQAGKTIIDFLTSKQIEFTLMEPSAGNWAAPDRKKLFEIRTGWHKKSNRDTRSAAYFGYTFLIKNKINIGSGIPGR